MAMTPLSVAEINAAIISQVETEIGATIPILPIAFVRVLAKAIAGVVVLLYKYTGFIFLQLFVATASDQVTTIGGKTLTPLTEWGRLVGAGDPIPAVPAQLTADITVTTTSVDVIPAGTPVVNDATGIVYTTDTDIIKDATTKSVGITAGSDQSGGDGSGAVGNLASGTIVSFTSPIADTLRDLITTGTTVVGVDGEATSVYRQRIIDRFQKPPQGGALADYEIWGEETLGILNVYPYTGPLPGTVDCYVEADTALNADGIPTAGQLTATLANINLDSAGRATRRPANALAFTFPITRSSFEVEVISLDAPDPAATEAAVTAGLETLFFEFEPFIGGLTVTARDRITAAEVSGVVHDIVAANGGTFSSLLMKAPFINQATFAAFTVASADDASETGGAVNITDTTLSFALTTLIGMRFTNVTVPVGATIVSAVLNLTPSVSKDVYSTLIVRGEADDDPATFTVAANNISSRITTINSTTFIPPAFVLDVAQSVDVKAIVEDIIAIGGWASGNAMAFIISSQAGSDRTIHSFDGAPAKGPQLSVTYRTAVGIVATTVYTLGIGEKAKVTSVTFV